MAGPLLSIPPKPDEFELSLFGPGYGEAIVLHLGDNQWFLVDSCVDGTTRQPAALLYLDQLGVNVQADVAGILATHWHDDHIRGLSKIVDTCQSADFYCSGALRNKEFSTLVLSYGGREATRSGSGVQEFFKILNSLQSQSKKPRWAFSDKLLLRKNTSAGNIEIHALSPSDAEVLRTLLGIGELVESSRFLLGRATSPSPNHSAVALWIRVGDLSILLGSDLEETTSPDTGWSVIVSSTTRPLGRATVFKIPHHASSNGHNDDVWKYMLDDDPIAILTPFSRGNVYLPKDTDIRRITSLTSRAFATASNKKAKSQRRPRVVEDQIKAITRYLRPLNSSFGHVRLRLSEGEWRIELFGAAFDLAVAA